MSRWIDKQGDLFGKQPEPAPHYPDAPGHRGVETSIAAAEDIKPALGRLQSMVEDAIREAGSHGLTTDEVCDELALKRWTVQPRTSELCKKGVIKDSGQRRENVTGKKAIVWVIA